MDESIKATSLADERQLQDACHAMMDIAHRIIGAQNAELETPAGPTDILAGVICLAVQTVFLCDDLGRENPNVRIAVDQALAKYMGVSMGVGHCIYAAETEAMKLVAHLAVMRGIKTGMASRAKLDAKGPRT